MSTPYYGALQRDEYGDLPREQDHELPDGDMEAIQAALREGSAE